MGIPPKLTERQIKFAELLVFNEGRKTRTECAFEAGYETRARQAAHELTNPKIYPNVVAEIGRYKQEYSEKYNITFDNHKQILAKIRDKALEKEMFGVAGRMEELRGKLMGYYVDKSMNINKNSLDNLSEEELNDRMKQILEEYKPLLEEKNDK